MWCLKGEHKHSFVFLFVFGGLEKQTDPIVYQVLVFSPRRAGPNVTPWSSSIVEKEKAFSLISLRFPLCFLGGANLIQAGIRTDMGGFPWRHFHIKLSQGESNGGILPWGSKYLLKRYQGTLWVWDFLCVSLGVPTSIPLSCVGIQSESTP